MTCLLFSTPLSKTSNYGTGKFEEIEISLHITNLQLSEENTSTFIGQCRGSVNRLALVTQEKLGEHVWLGNAEPASRGVMY